MFLKPTKVDGLKLNDLYLGSSVTILSRTLRIVDFGDLSTKKALDGKSERYTEIRTSSTSDVWFLYDPMPFANQGKLSPN